MNMLKKFTVSLGLLAALFMAAPAQAQTYVVPRVYTAFNGFVTNGVTYTGFLTNQLNPIGWHNGNFLLSEYSPYGGTTNGIGTNQVFFNLYGVVGPNNNYTNPAAGTNFALTYNPLLTWNNNITASNTYVGSSTNINQAQGDGYGVYKYSFTVVATNNPGNYGGFNVQLDWLVTP